MAVNYASAIFAPDHISTRYALLLACSDRWVFCHRSLLTWLNWGISPHWLGVSVKRKQPQRQLKLYTHIRSQLRRKPNLSLLWRQRLRTIRNWCLPSVKWLHTSNSRSGSWLQCIVISVFVCLWRHILFLLQSDERIRTQRKYVTGSHVLAFNPPTYAQVCILHLGILSKIITVVYTAHGFLTS